jgi:protein-tyrosine phosphatase
MMGISKGNRAFGESAIMILHSSNFREIAVGNIARGTLYRSNHPVRWNGEQVRGIIRLARKAGIKTVVNLSDNEWTLEWKVTRCPWYKRMFEAGNVITVNIMVFDILAREFHKKLKTALLFMAEREPPYLIHCEAGIDRTGFLSIILEAFMGASLADIAKDYMLSTVDGGEYSPKDCKNSSIFVIDTFSRITGEPVQAQDDLRALAAVYLTEQIELGTGELAILAKKLSGFIPT